MGPRNLSSYSYPLTWIIFQNVQELIACSDVPIKEKWFDDSFMCHRATHVPFRAIPFMF
jgi:hypothetical protein